MSEKKSVDDTACADDFSSSLDTLRATLIKEVARIVRAQNAELLDEHRSIKPLLSIEEVAETLNVSKRTTESIVAAGKLQPIWVKGQRRFHPDAVEAYMRRQARGKSQWN